MARKKLSKKLRFEVFKRDCFTCQYCGKKAPDVVLHVDHIKPVSKGGKNDILNLITSCYSCNLGKGARELSDSSMIDKQHKQLSKIEEKRSQFEMMIKWRDGLEDILKMQVDEVEKAMFHESSTVLNKSGRSKIERLIKNKGFKSVLSASSASRSQYAEYDENEDITKESAEKIFSYVGRIIKAKEKYGDDEEMKEIFYIRAIVRNRMNCDEKYCLYLLKEAYRLGETLDELKNISKTAKNWTQYRTIMEDIIDELQEEERLLNDES